MLLIGASFIGRSFAYLDPGTGVVIGSSLWALVVALFSAVAAFLIKYFWNPIKRGFSKLFKKSKK